MRPLVLILFLSACVQTSAENVDGPGTGVPNGYCESQADCDPDDRCWLIRKVDSHLVDRGLPETMPINRCWPRSGENDWCVGGEDWCLEGLICGAGEGQTGVCQ